MTASLTSSVQEAARSELRPRNVIARVTGRKSIRAGAAWGVVFGLYVATQAFAYSSNGLSSATRRLLIKTYAHNVGISALVGPARMIGTVPGYTAWKCLTVLAIIGAVWGVLTSTKLTRGEEDAGRWELLLAGQVTPRSAMRQALVGFFFGAVALFITTSVITVAVGQTSKIGISVGAALYFALAIVCGAAMFLAVGALCGELATSRRQAAGLASAVLGISYALRMVADAGVGLSGLRWASPLGWIEELQPLTSPRPLALIPIAAFIVALSVATLHLAGRRDLGEGTLSIHSNTRTPRRLPTTPLGLDVYLSRSTLLAWSVPILAYGMLLGGIAKSGGKIITSSTSLRLVFSRLGVSGAEAFLGVSLLIMSITLGFVAVGQVSAMRKEEANGQLVNLLVHPYSRATWMAQRVLLSVAILFVGGLLVGVATWLGAALGHADVSLWTMLVAGLNVAVPALLLFAAGVLAFAFIPRWTTAATYTLLVWFFLVEIVAGVAKINHFVLDLSAYHQMAAAPAAPVDWTSNAIMLALAVASMSVAAFTFQRRDLQGD
jgi:ABC-2 type transport system permease protein